MEGILWIIGIIALIIIAAIGKEVISDIDYKRQLSGKRPARDRAKSNRRGSVDSSTISDATMDSIEAQRYTESSVNNISGL